MVRDEPQVGHLNGLARRFDAVVFVHSSQEGSWIVMLGVVTWLIASAPIEPRTSADEDERAR